MSASIAERTVLAREVTYIITGAYKGGGLSITVIKKLVKSKLGQSVPLSYRQKLPNMEVSLSTAPCDATAESRLRRRTLFLEIPR